MKKFLCLPLILSSFTYAEYKPYNFNMIEVSGFKGRNYPNAWGGSTKDTLFEIQNYSRYNLLDLYWFVDRSNILNDPNLSDKKESDSNYIYGEINPRISLDGFFNRDLSIGIAKEWFLATQFDFDNVHGKRWGKNQGVRKYYIGIGNYLDIPGFEYFRTNLYARYVDKNYGRNEDSWDGYMLNFAYGATLYQFENGMKIGFNGWLDYDFGARHCERGQTSDSFQWQNQLRLYLTKNISVSYTYQINHHFTQMNQNSSNSDSSAIGVHYAFFF